MSKPKFCYVLPSYRRDSAEHFAHAVDFLQELATQVELAVIVERGEAPPIPRAASIAVLPQDSLWRRELGLVREALRLWRQGYRKFFVRISAPAAIPLGLLRPLGIQTYYWHSGMSKEMQPGGFSWPAIRARLRDDLPFWLTRQLVHRLVTGPERMARYYAEAYGMNPRRIVVCYNDINLKRFPRLDAQERQAARQSLDFPADRKVVLSVHRHSPIRRPLFYYPEIIRQVAAADPAVLFVLVGGGPQERELEQALAEANLTPYVRMLGALPNVELPRYYAAADLFIMPSWIEGFPRVLLEAMATGVPFVTTDAGGVADILSPLQQRYMLPRADRNGFAQGVVELLANPEQRQALVVDGLEQVQRYATERVAAMYLERVILGE